MVSDTISGCRVREYLDSYRVINTDSSDYQPGFRADFHTDALLPVYFHVLLMGNISNHGPITSSNNHY